MGFGGLLNQLATTTAGGGMGAVVENYPVASGYSVSAGDVVDIDYDYIEISKLAVGTEIQIEENNSPVTYTIVHQGLPGSMYDESCNGTWVARKSPLSKRQWNPESSSNNNYADSSIEQFLRTTVYNYFDTETKNLIKQVKIPYSTGYRGTVQSGANGLSCKIFMFSGAEVGWGPTYSNEQPDDGNKLDFFIAGDTNNAYKKRKYFNGGFSDNNGSCWLRSPNLDYINRACVVMWNGAFNGQGYSSTFGVTPVFILNPNAMVDSLNKNLVPPRTINYSIIKSSTATTAIALESGSAGDTIPVCYSGIVKADWTTEGQQITSDGVYGAGIVDGVLQVWSKYRPELTST